MKHLILVLVLMVALQRAEAVYIEFSGTPGSTPVTMTFEQDIDFLVTIGQTNQIGSEIYFVIEDLFASPDAARTGVTSSGEPGELLSFSVGTYPALPCWNWFDHHPETSGDATPNDGVFGYSGPTVDMSAGDIITLQSGTMVSESISPADFQLGVSGDYNLYVISSFTTAEGGYSGRISENGVVPEPASALLLGIGAVTIWIRRMNRRMNRRYL